MKYYVDTCVWIDFVEKQKYAEDFFYEAIRNSDTILVSEFVFEEYVRFKLYADIHSIIAILKSRDLMKLIKPNDIQDRQAQNLGLRFNVPFGDALHAILSRDNDAILITRDKHFLNLRHVCKIKLF